jgi:7-cyano-7-deazaguanine reductase
MGKRDSHYTAGLHALGARVDTPDSPTRDILEVFPNPAPGSDYTVRLECAEFTSMCPVTGQPDFGRFDIEYAPDGKCLESKSVKLYLGSFRSSAAFWEELCNRIADDLNTVVAPRWLHVTGYMNTRGGIAIVCNVQRPGLTKAIE